MNVHSEFHIERWHVYHRLRVANQRGKKIVQREDRRQDTGVAISSSRFTAYTKLTYWTLINHSRNNPMKKQKKKKKQEKYMKQSSHSFSYSQLPAGGKKREASLSGHPATGGGGSSRQCSSGHWAEQPNNRATATPTELAMVSSAAGRRCTDRQSREFQNGWSLSSDQY